MFIKSLIISTELSVIREIKFSKGINFIVDETPSTLDNENESSTGNNVGKTTVLKLIDFCLGGDSKNVYSDTEIKRDKHILVENFLKDNAVLITLILKKDLDIANSEEIKIQRNFLDKKKKISNINDEFFTDNPKDNKFEQRLLELIFPQHKVNKPSFRQIISHNIRYKDSNINKTLETLGNFAKNVEYEALHLYMFGCTFDEGEEKQKISEKMTRETTFKSRLEKDQTMSGYKATLELIKSEIKSLEAKKMDIKINENFITDFETLNKIKYSISKISSVISALELRKNLIIETQQDLMADVSAIDMEQIRNLYDQAKIQMSGIQKSFEELVNYHNSMIEEKIKFITKELPRIENDIIQENEKRNILLIEERKISLRLSESASYDDLEKLITELTQKYEKKGEYEKIISLIQVADDNISGYETELNKIDEYIFSEEFKSKLTEQQNKFNKYFSSVSNTLYKEKYLLKYDIEKNKKTHRPFYKFTIFDPNNPNISSGKKQGEIMCFDIAYIMFADNEDIPCFHFALYDKKELVHDNQLVGVSKYIADKNIQFIASILKDKLPLELQDEKNFVTNLSQDVKLFKIENKD